jgi:hypothetical protein
VVLAVVQQLRVATAATVVAAQAVCAAQLLQQAVVGHLNPH